MANQDPGSKTDRTGGDVTKAEVVATPAVPKTYWDVLNNQAADDRSPKY